MKAFVYKIFVDILILLEQFISRAQHGRNENHNHIPNLRNINARKCFSHGIHATSTFYRSDIPFLYYAITMKYTKNIYLLKQSYRAAGILRPHVENPCTNSVTKPHFPQSEKLDAFKQYYSLNQTYCITIYSRKIREM